MLETFRTKMDKWRKEPLKLVLLAIVLMVTLIFITRHAAAVRLRQHTVTDATTLVRTITAKATPAIENIYLPGFVMGWHETPIFARAKGYVKVWYVDIGYRVHKGDVLAVIERPELDAELRQAEAFLKYATAQNELGQITARRWVNLLKTDSVSQQATDDKTYNAAALAASVFQARSNLNKLRAYVGFETVVAPFDGIISSRQTDIGALINIGSNPAEAQPLFKIVQSDKLRLYVNVPQNYSAKITPKMTAHLTFAEHPGKVFSARLLNTAEAIDPVLQTLQVEFLVENNESILLPGGYTMVEMSILHDDGSVILPVNTLIFQSEGLQVAMVDEQQHVVLKNINVDTDFGKTVQINRGIQPGEHIILNPPDSLYAGQHVRVMPSNIDTAL